MDFFFVFSQILVDLQHGQEFFEDIILSRFSRKLIYIGSCF